MATFYRGIPATSESIKRSQEKQLSKYKLPKNFNQKVDLAKVNKDVMTSWILKKVSKSLYFIKCFIFCSIYIFFFKKSFINKLEINKNHSPGKLTFEYLFIVAINHMLVNDTNNYIDMQRSTDFLFIFEKCNTYLI